MSTGTQTGGSALKRTAGSVGLVAGGFVTAVLLGLVVGFVAAAAGIELTRDVIAAIDLPLTQAGLAVAALAFLARVGGWNFVSIRVPTSREALTAAGVVAVGVAAESARQLAVRFTSLEAASTLSADQEVAAWVGVVVLASAILVAPVVEELLFRGVVQRWVREASSVPVGIAVATIAFVPIHGLGIVGAPSTASALSLVAVLTVVSVALGVAYARTDNLAVPMLGHAAYNASTVVVGLLVHGTA